MALGLIQGLTEFLPVSSSGHLVIFERLFGVEAHTLAFEVLVHIGTLIAVLIFFRVRLSAIVGSFLRSPFKVSGDGENVRYTRLGWFLILGTVPAAIVGLAFKDYIELAFASPRWSAGMLLATAAILIPTKWAKEEDGELNLIRTIIVGLAQAVAIMPGISRSGSTISAGMFSGISKSEAAEFSFLLSIPAILGAAVLETPEFIADLSNKQLGINYLVGAIIAAVVGYLSIAFLMKVIRKGKFFYFGLYCAAAGLLGIIFL